MSEYLGHEDACPICFNKLDAATHVGEGAKPSPGDVSVCFYCAELLMFDEALRHVCLDEHGGLASLHPEKRRLLLIAQKAIRERPMLHQVGHPDYSLMEFYEGIKLIVHELRSVPAQGTPVFQAWASGTIQWTEESCEQCGKTIILRAVPAQEMVMVPREPTTKMLEAGAMEAVGDSFVIHDERQLERIWSEMLSAVSQEKPE